MAYRVELDRGHLAKELDRYRKRQPRLFRRLGEKLRALGSDPRPPGCEPISGVPDHYRVRVGDYRIVYHVDDQQELVTIMAIGHRREVYQRWRQ